MSKLVSISIYCVCLTFKTDADPHELVLIGSASVLRWCQDDIQLTIVPLTIIGLDTK